MFKNYLKVALRNIWKNKVYSLINIVGLAFGLAACLLIVLFVVDELSYDRYHENADRIYRICSRGMIGNHELDQAVVSTPLAATVRDIYPEVEHSTRISNWFTREGIMVRREDSDVDFREYRFHYADANVFDVFDIPLIKGDPKNALKKPNTVVITEDTAKKYYGDEDPIGKILLLEDGKTFSVTGIAENIPSNSHWPFDFLASFLTDPVSKSPGWLTNVTYTYVVLKKGTSVEQFQEKVLQLAKKYVDPMWKQFVNFDNFSQQGSYYEFYAQPLTDIHLRSDIDSEIQPNSNIIYVYIFSVIAVLILLIACTNFMSLATARSATRAREVGMRKVMGSNQARLIRQFLTESTFMSFIAAVVAIILAKILLPYFNNLTLRALELNLIKHWTFIPAFIGVVFFVGLVSGFYPAFFLASFNPINVLKGKLQTGMKSGFMRKGLVVFQFAITIGIIIGTFVVFDQLNFFQNRKLGFDKEQVVVIKGVSVLGKQIPTFRDELRKQSSVVNATVTSSVPGYFIPHQLLLPDKKDMYEVVFVWGIFSDEYYAETYGLELAEGSFFSGDLSRDQNSIVINETTARELGMEKPLERYISRGGPPMNIVGVIKDFHYESLHSKIRPFAASSIQNFWQMAKFISVRLQPGAILNTLRSIEEEWKSFAPGEPFEYFFLDRSLENLYRAEQRTGKIFTTFSAFAIFIACLGLFGLISYAAEQRTREIGIRKVLGASIPNILVLISKEIVYLLIVAIIIACPLAYIAMNNWLNSFAYRANFNFFNFLIAAALATVIALLTVSYQAIKAATKNPVDSIRYE